ncbi:hypothetical protein A2125_01315 [Candidatus Woesebacteria bacterium GWB1_43_5]|uniref:DUF5660 domain-containing protein n=1 Tax=Candidatus Woesebacteria bacterium GWB1_43_5 TaxID=1802474 RepID=A0A1F7WR11_9BACT|nr:MAG: hypothetical protein A2125_01315 [Candidatus Woesebacteria bacterium GWB1_43_5]
MNPKKQGQRGQNNKNQTKVRNQNVLEALKDIGSTTNQSFKNDLLAGTSKDFLRQLMGVNFETKGRKISGDLMPGESIEMDKAYSGEQEKVIKERRQLSFLNKLKDEEIRLVSEKSNDLKVKLNALQSELLALAQSTQNLAAETQVAVMSAPVEPGVYHIAFYEKLIEFIKSFRKQINSAGVWMAETNKRAQKKNFWGKYKKHGSKFLLSADHYLTRSAG